MRPGDLIRMRVPLYSYSSLSIGRLAIPGSVCLILDIANPKEIGWTDAISDKVFGGRCDFAVCLLVDGVSCWTKLAEGDAEVINETV